jgi:hypothetical protein
MNPQPAVQVRRKPDPWVPILVLVVIFGVMHDGMSGRFDDSDKPSHVAVFSRRVYVPDTRDFRGGDVVAVFGSNRIDLRRVAFSEGTPKIGAVALFGKVEIIVPPGSRISGETVPLLGKVDLRTGRGSEIGPPIRLDAVAMFGSVVVHN